MNKLHWCLLLSFAGHAAMAQTAATNTGILYVSGSSDILYVASDFTNNSGASLTNNGNLYVRGNLANSQPSMSAGTGTLYLNGAGAQSVNGPQVFKTYHFNSNNVAGITLNNNLSISGIHTFSAGLIHSSATPNYLIYEAGSSYTGSSDTRHVNGWVKKNGNTSFIFPVGDLMYERPIAMSSLSSGSEFNVRYSTNTPNTAYSYMQPPIVMVNPNEYWFVNQVSGGTALLTLNWDYNKVYFPNWIVPDLRVASFNGSKWVSQGGVATGTTTATGSITSNAISSFTIFTIGSASWILPVTLTHFDAIRQNGTTLIGWITEKEDNVRAYFIERSNNGNSFYTIGQTTAHNTAGTHRYEYADRMAISNKAWYRLRIIDEDGRETYSKVVLVSETNNNNLLLIRNPVRTEVQLMAGSINGMFDYSLRNIAGQTVQQGKIHLQPGNVQTILLNGKFPPGSYVLSVIGKTDRFSYKLMIE